MLLSEMLTACEGAVLQLAPKRIHKVRTRGGNIKYRALRLDSGNFSWGSEGEEQESSRLLVM